MSTKDEAEEEAVDATETETDMLPNPGTRAEGDPGHAPLEGLTPDHPQVSRVESLITNPLININYLSIESIFKTLSINHI